MIEEIELHRMADDGCPHADDRPLNEWAMIAQVTISPWGNAYTLSGGDWFMPVHFDLDALLHKWDDDLWAGADVGSGVYGTSFFLRKKP